VDKSSDLLRIGEVAAFFGVSVKSLRLYEKIGILKPVVTDNSTGYRYYSADQVKELDAILEMRELGFSLAEIKGLLERGQTNEQYMEALTHKKFIWQERLAQVQEIVDNIDEIIQKLENSHPPVKLHGLTEDERAMLLSRLACLDVNLHDVHGRNLLSDMLWL